MIMNSPEVANEKNSNNNFIFMLAAANILIAGAAMLFIAENPEEINNLPTQSVSYKNHFISTFVNK